MKKIATLTLATSLILNGEASYSSCPKHEVMKNGHCICKKGYVRHDKECKRCPDHAFYDCTHNKCKCEPTYEWDHVNFQCKMKPEP